jgi:murein DD-endopeptidase MepM/ murein hydrolase activator NlpD
LVFGPLLLAGCAAGGTASLGEPASDVILPSEVRLFSDRVTRGSTLASLLRAHAVAEQEVSDLIARVATVFDLRAMRADRPYRLAVALGGALRRFEYEIDNDRVLTVTRSSESDGGFVAAIDPIAKTTEVSVVRGTIDRSASSLFAAMGRAGEGVELSLALADVFASEVDFNSELQVGDHFEVLVEKRYRAPDAWPGDEDESGFVGYGAVLAADLNNAGRELRAVRFTRADGSIGYFDEHGVSLRRFFLRSPLKFDPVVTSRFSQSRMHPVLGYSRAHLGVDYRAPIGAPVIAVADGVVVSAGMNGSAGRMVHLRHSNGYETQYLHLSSISVRRGARVRQGEVIALSGASGVVTGPHLDYRVRKNGQFIDPVAAHRAMPPGDPVAASEMAAFIAVRDESFAALGSTPVVMPGVTAAE